MEEQLVSFETAHLAKEKGFGLGNDYIYLYTFYNSETKELTTEPSAYKRNKSSSPHGQLQMSSVEVGVSRGMDNSTKEYTLAPTQSLLQKWLREEHNIHIQTHPVINFKWGFTTYKVDNSLLYGQATGYIGEKFMGKTYEEAMEKGLQHALTLIKS